MYVINTEIQKYRNTECRTLHDWTVTDGADPARDKDLTADAVRVELEVQCGGNRTELEQFASWLLTLGNGEIEQDEHEMVAIPPELCMEEGADVDALVDWVFPDLARVWDLLVNYW